MRENRRTIFKNLIKEVSRNDQVRHAELLQGAVALVIVHEFCNRRALTTNGAGRVVITSYSIHYTKLYEVTVGKPSKR